MRLRIPVEVRWADLDAYGHVNNAAAFTLLEEARIRAFWADSGASEAWPTAILAMGTGTATQTLVARQEIEYHRPIPFARTGLLVQLWIGHMGGSSLEVCYSVHEADADAARIGDALDTPTYAVAATTLVMVTTATGAPTRITRAQREAWEPFVEPPARFRHRR
ncbi:acyl-CoA thioesterase [Serinibacter salmoneus]|uniref:Acyl-CoA thioester hydrolase n=1 Tax=Serinibacter salmoneus TaxID=556530 RepID=A0A2A9D0N6_9MICO|nr:thioesterase family protein [Serinibacter salmoneus]PFG19951.1 acyl-CoA thioester hydrolase [Serinibacter salmoneus]